MSNGQKLWKRAKQLIPGGNMLLSKRAEMFLPEEWPAYFSKAKGCKVWDLGGREFTDMIFSVGPNTLGYGQSEVDAAVQQTIAAGNMSTLNCPEEVYLAEAILKKDGGVGLVEVAGRGGGFIVFDRLVPAVSGVNIARLTPLQAVGLPIGPVHSREGAEVLRFFPSRPGVLQEISGFEAANRLHGVEAAAFVHVGDRFQGAAAAGDRPGYILARADTPSSARQLADQAQRLVRFDIRECA